MVAIAARGPARHRATGPPGHMPVTCRVLSRTCCWMAGPPTQADGHTWHGGTAPLPCCASHRNTPHTPLQRIAAHTAHRCTALSPPVRLAPLRPPITNNQTNSDGKASAQHSIQYTQQTTIQSALDASHPAPQCSAPGIYIVLPPTHTRRHRSMHLACTHLAWSPAKSQSSRVCMSPR